MPTLIHTPTPTLDKSLDFYKKLNYHQMTFGNHHIVTDGKVFIEINPERTARPGVIFYGTLEHIDTHWLAQHTVGNTKDGKIILRDPNGVWVYFANENEKLELPQVGEQFGFTGNFSGMSIESSVVGQTLAFWQALGFQLTAGSEEAGWLSLTNADHFTVSIMKPLVCPHLFINPSMTFFNGKEGNPECIRKIRAAGIPIMEEITVFNKNGDVDNIIIQDPGGYGFFVYND